MIRHNLHMRFLEGTSDADKQEIYDRLDGLKDHLGGILDFQHRRNISPETHLIRGFEDMVWIDFTDAAARDTYLADSKHRAIGARIKELCGGADGLYVCDVEVS